MTIAVVTGAAGGIGSAICDALGADGHAIAVVDLQPDRTEAAAQRLRTGGIDAFAAPCDITDSRAVAAMAAAVLARGDVAILVNNAGRATAADLEATDDAAWHDEIGLNLDGAFYVTRAFLPHLKSRGSGVLISIASVNGVGVFGNPPYSVAKAGLINFTRQVAVEYGPLGIRAVSIVPGSVRSPAWDERLRRDPALFEEVKRFYPLRRIAEPADVANTVAFIASDKARAITGTEIVIDCGLTAGNPLLAETIIAGDRR